MKEFKDSAMQFFTILEELKKKRDLNIQAMVLEYKFDTDDCDLFFVTDDDKVINLKKRKCR